MNVRGERIFVGLSGGVDSAVAAALLQRKGAHVTGVFIKGWYPPGILCTWATERRDAMRVAARLHIPFLTLDASAEYKKGVIDYMLAEYRAGRTPNPDVMCNREVKFGIFYRFAKAHGADAIAMGHYRAGEKDQNYFLWAVPKAVLEATIFPVGDLEKNEVRFLAKKFNLPVAKKKDSQGVCFLGNISIEEFLRSEFDSMPGRAVDEGGTLVGTHDGVLFHTIGERIALRGTRKTGPWFVLAKDVAKNEFTVGKERFPVGASVRRAIPFVGANWFGEPASVTEAQYRYRGQRVPGYIDGGRFVAEKLFSEIPAPGQSIVFYNDTTLVGGGTITA
ncbi:MAG TPA: tRNA 2-thiouridine(34) synthase MnmA [Candidatus Paceibacterota bacterium]|nr:tRNA 2-thiouridine(34) synthase MnmA [Candidatus Paceibacterota bacterium]